MASGPICSHTVSTTTATEGRAEQLYETVCPAGPKFSLLGSLESKMVNPCLNYTRDDTELINATFAPTRKIQSDVLSHPLVCLHLQSVRSWGSTGTWTPGRGSGEGSTPCHINKALEPCFCTTGFLDNIMKAVDFHLESAQL